MRRIYIAGSITGEDSYLEKFERWATYFTERNWEAVNPAAVTASVGCANDRAVCLRIDLPLLLTCSHIFLMRDYCQSIGARLEHQIASCLKMGIIYESEMNWLLEDRLLK